jgi:cyclic beta-1,2-glucan synthetase
VAVISANRAAPPWRRLAEGGAGHKKAWVNISLITAKLERLVSWRQSQNGDLLPQNDEQPLRDELFNVDQLERHAEGLASAHQLATGRRADKLIPRLNDNEAILVRTYELVTAATKQKRRIAPAAEWLLDNFYLIEDQIRTARRHLPQSYSRELPRLANGSAAHNPRTYGIALELISHVDGRVDAVSLNRFVAAYQSVAPLKLGELWAVPIMLRLALIENLRRVAVRLSAGRRDQDQANDWAERMVSVVEQNPTDLILVMADMARANPPLSGAFLAEITRHLQGQSPHFAFATSWLEHRVAEQGLTIEQLVRAEGQAQAADQVSMGNSVSSLRFLGSYDWRGFVEDQSVVEQVLRTDPARAYADMDFTTRDRYRHVVEAIAKRSSASESEVASKAIQLAEKSSDERMDDGSARATARAAHVGYYLIDDGRAALERSAAARWSPRHALARLGGQHPLFFYFFGVLLVTGAATAAFLAWSSSRSDAEVPVYLLGIPLLVCALHLGIGVVNWLASLVVPPRPLPRLDFKSGIPPEHRTMVVVPTMLSSPANVESLLEGLEIRYLANRDPNLHFALLTDFEDAPHEVVEKDDELVRLAREGIEALNLKYESQRADIFFLFHRPRLWNAGERMWMGYERKRGKLSEFNAFLRGTRGRFATVAGDATLLADVRFVITLDTDTQLPRDSARQMVGAMAHPLNRPVLDGTRSRVVTGYGIMQPRVGVSLPSAQRSWFVRLFAGDSGLDPYTRVVSDLYQDAFGEGSFIGKGIYDVDAFEQCCNDFAENAILSHDLLESAYARSALLSDVELYEDFPARYPADVSRRHRWVRGDWQIGAWTLPWVPNRERKWVANPISALARWKISDNLRRSLTPVAMLALLLGAWLIAGPPWDLGATLFVVAMIGVVPVLSVLSELVRKPADLPWLTHWGATFRGFGKQLAPALATLVLLPYDAFMSLDAIVRTLVRMLWTKTKMLEWKTSSDAHHGAEADVAGFVRSMWSAPAIAVAVFLFLLQFSPSVLPAAGPLLAFWLVSPVVAWWLSRPLAAAPVNLTASQRTFLRKLARQTWRYFEVYVSAEDNWLPPDNVQEQPARAGVASRTSPTNIGVGLLSDLAAYDFGYCSMDRLLGRTQKTLGTLARMERFRGHFYNWYDTRTLKPLAPRYVSMVDSGNLAAHLLVLRSGILELVDAPLPLNRIFEGLNDTAQILSDAAHGLSRPSAMGRPPRVSENVVQRIRRVQTELAKRPETLGAAAALLRQLMAHARDIVASVGPDAELLWWARTFEQSCIDQHDDLVHMAAWAELPRSPDFADGSVPAAHRRELLARLEAARSLRQIAALPSDAFPEDFRKAIAASAGNAADRIKFLEQAAHQCQELADMDFSFLFDKSRDLFAIGYNVADNRLDNSFYDLLASEARLGSFVAIAQDQLGQEHWFALGRLLTKAGGATALVSWSGSMFEYLMPLIVMPTYGNTLLDETYRAVVRRQIDYGRQRGVPWGMSESGFNTVDGHLNYQYRAFGVPGLGLKRGLAEDVVVAPYAGALALMVAPEEACRNLERLAADGQQGAFGMYEAVDYTPARTPPGEARVTVRQFMAHHQGMSLMAFAYVLLGKPMQRRFAADPMLRAADLLLQERIPKASVPIFPHVAEAGATRSVTPEEEGAMRISTDPAAPTPEVHLLSNGRYHVAVTSAGGGFSRWRDFAVTRWREDVTRDCWGSFCYLRDLDSGVLWSTAHQPTLKPGKRYQAIFTQARAEFRRSDDRIDTHTEISVSPEDDIELRRVSITNRSKFPRTVEVTSYAEVVLAPASHDLSHPAFSNLFVQTELVNLAGGAMRQALLGTRRPRSAEERPPWMMHLMTVRGTTIGTASFETDRSKFIGRGRSLAAPAAMEALAPLSGTEGPVLDPIFSIRNTIRLEPGESAQVDLVTGVAETRDAVISLAEKYSDSRLADRVFELAWTHSQILLRQLNATEAEAQAYGRLAGSVIFASGLRRAKPSILIRNRRGQSGLWGYGISGDLPIVLLRIRDRDRIELVRQTVQAHAYWRLKGLSVDLVIWNEDDSVYRQTLQDAIMDLVAASLEAALVDKPGGIFVRRGEQMSDEDRALLQTVARVVLVDDAGTLIEQTERRGRTELAIPELKPSRRAPEPLPAAEVPKRDLTFFNGLGGFSRDGREYIILLGPKQTTPAPWVNVIANAEFGTVISESGNAYTWAENSHEFRLTPWYNDPVMDVSGEALYVRDDETGRFWSPTPLPARGRNPYVVRHGFGYSIFEYAEDGIVTELCVYVATDAPVKFVRLKIANRSGRPRQLSVTGYSELVLGERRDKSLMHVVTELDPMSGALFARNAYSPEFADRVAFFECSESARTLTGDRTEFLGRNGAPANPAALRRVRLSGRVGAGLDPCAAMQAPLSLADGQEKDVVFILGAAQNDEQARHLLDRFRGASNARQALEGVWHYWSRTLGVVYLETPDPAVNFLANGWLVYQTLACRMWARTGFYQSGGAFGFRDQLQDAMALVHAEPRLLREHLLRAAGRQFWEGDVQHWWHPPVGRGVRTHFSDDYLWLPYATCRYVIATGDTGVLDEPVPFLRSRPLRPDEEANYDLPQIGDDAGTLYEHCLRALDYGLKFGVHGLPLIGCGDWNDGMNIVGQHGKGESVWLAFFLYDVLTQFAALAQRRGDDAAVDKYTIHAGQLRGHIEEHGWDGQWYRRAYFDDGTPLGSAANPECQIDSLSQSWSVLSGAGSRERSTIAMESLDQRLIRRDVRLIQLLDPPFDKSDLNPGYIKGYVPGVRENGGQYTHGAIWTVMAFAAMGDSRRAWELFSLINPIKHSGTPEAAALYRVEPYVVAADVYGVPPHTGRGGWTWYTGSAGWMYRLITESLVGLCLEVDKLRFKPCLPPSWSSFTIHYRYRETFYHIRIRNVGQGTAVRRLSVDGLDQADNSVPLVDDRRDHQVEVDIE